MQMARCGVVGQRDVVLARLADRRSVRGELEAPAANAADHLDLWRHAAESSRMLSLVRDRYELLEELGSGGEARVFKALDRQHGRIVALKVRRVRDEALREELLAEARVLLSLPPHPALPLVREDFFDRDDYVVAMDWVEGTDLATLLAERGRPGLAPSSLLAYLAQAAEALTHLHSQSPPVIHGDVKPSNLILTTGGRIKLVDFGLSSAPDAPGRRSGTPGLRAPELAAGGAPSRASDVYALAATAFTLLNGSPPAGVLPHWEGVDPVQAAGVGAGWNHSPQRTRRAWSFGSRKLAYPRSGKRSWRLCAATREGPRRRCRRSHAQRRG